MAQIKDIYVYMDWQESDSPIQMGVLHSVENSLVAAPLRSL